MGTLMLAAVAFMLVSAEVDAARRIPFVARPTSTTDYPGDVLVAFETVAEPVRLPRAWMNELSSRIFLAARAIQHPSARARYCHDSIALRLASGVLRGDSHHSEHLLAELALADRIERTYSPEMRLAIYIDNAWFGGGIYGARSAARTYFGRDVEELSLGEAFALASFAQRVPRDASFVRERRDLLIDLAHRTNRITTLERDVARAEPLPPFR